jgi:hypothetical protein
MARVLAGKQSVFIYRYQNNNNRKQNPFKICILTISLLMMNPMDVVVSQTRMVGKKKPFLIKGCYIYYISMPGTTNLDKTEKLGITLSASILQKIDSKRGDIPRSRYIRRAIESYLKKGVGRK